MTIHHDKLAYGRLSSMKEDADEAKLSAMARRLSESNAEAEEVKPQPAESKEQALDGDKKQN